jgi:hypothetical protein
MHTGAWLPVWGWGDDEAWQRLIDWINDTCQKAGGRLIVTPALGQLNGPEGLKKIANGAARQDANGQGPGSDWQPGDGPIVVVWPRERTLQRCVQKVAGLPEQSIIVLEQAATDDAQSFQGWASAVGAYNAADDQYESSGSDPRDQLDGILTWYENELSLRPASASSAYPTSAPMLRQKLQAVRAGGYDEDFVISYAIALGYQGDLKRLRQHYSAAES